MQSHIAATQLNPIVLNGIEHVPPIWVSSPKSGNNSKSHTFVKLPDICCDDLVTTSQSDISVVGSPTIMVMDAAVSSPTKEFTRGNTSPVRSANTWDGTAISYCVFWTDGGTTTRRATDFGD